VAPPATHADTGVECNLATYSRRGWCRLEQWAHLATAGTKHMYIADGGEQVLRDAADDGSWWRDSIRVFDGDFSYDEDRVTIVDSVIGLWALALMKSNTPEGMRVQALVREVGKDVIFPVSLCGNLIARLEALHAATQEHEHEKAERKRQAGALSTVSSERVSSSVKSIASGGTGRASGGTGRGRRRASSIVPVKRQRSLASMLAEAAAKERDRGDGLRRSKSGMRSSRRHSSAAGVQVVPEDGLSRPGKRFASSFSASGLRGRGSTSTSATHLSPMVSRATSLGAPPLDDRWCGMLPSRSESLPVSDTAPSSARAVCCHAASLATATGVHASPHGGAACAPSSTVASVGPGSCAAAVPVDPV